MVNLDYLYNPDAAKLHFDTNYFSDKKLGFKVIENGTILPCKIFPKTHQSLGGIVDSEDNYIKESFIHVGTGGKYTPPPESIQHSSETVIYTAVLYYLWGHAITDNLRRFWFLKNEIFKNEFKNCPIVYIAFNGQHLEQQKNFCQLLEILEIDVNRLQVIKQPTQFEKIILPDEAFFRDNKSIQFTEEYREMIDCVRNFGIKNRTSTSNKKIYYFHSRREQVGAERLAEYFKSKGYEVVSPEKLTFYEQLNLLINCESFISTLGSCSHNSMFLRDGTKSIIIPRGGDRITSTYQQAADSIHPLNITYIDSSLSIFGKVQYGPFCYIISKQLKEFFGDEFLGYDEEDFKTFLEYVKYCISKNLTTNAKALKYYGTVFSDFLSQLKQQKNLIMQCSMPPYWETFKSIFSYQTHVSRKGWCSWIKENKISNSIEQQLQIEAIKISFPSRKVYYSVYYSDKEGWLEEVSNGEMAGTTGKSKPIMGMKIHLDEAGTREFDILYRMHKFDNEWTSWAKNGEVIYSYGQKINAIQIKLEPKT